VTSMVSRLSSSLTSVEAASHPQALAVVNIMLNATMCLRDIVRVTAR